MRNLLENHGENCIHVSIADASSSKDKTQVEVTARQTVLRIFRFLKQFPGLGNLTIEYLAPECGIRETAVIMGEEIITAEDYSTGRVWPDSLCYAFYPIDLHLNTPDGCCVRNWKKAWCRRCLCWRLSRRAASGCWRPGAAYQATRWPIPL